MKKNYLKAIAVLLSSAVLTTSCIGSFPVFHKVHSWNQNVSSSKFVNELVFICFHIIPVYEVCYLADGLIFNSIEFWSGKSPVANSGKTSKMKGGNGDVYSITTTDKGYSIVDETKGESFNLTFNEKEQTWNAEFNGASYKLLTMNEDGTVTMNMRNGESLTVSPDAVGLELANEFVAERSANFDLALR